MIEGPSIKFYMDAKKRLEFLISLEFSAKALQF